ncbi:MAG: hypothetical protein ABIS29_10810 [Vicinamibacterales bacterium]
MPIGPEQTGKSVAGLMLIALVNQSISPFEKYTHEVHKRTSILRALRNDRHADDGARSLPLPRREATNGVEYREYLPWYPLILCGVRTGLRLGELLGLQSCSSIARPILVVLS